MLFSLASLKALAARNLYNVIDELNLNFKQNSYFFSMVNSFQLVCTKPSKSLKGNFGSDTLKSTVREAWYTIQVILPQNNVRKTIIVNDFLELLCSSKLPPKLVAKIVQNMPKGLMFLIPASIFPNTIILVVVSIQIQTISVKGRVNACRSIYSDFCCL